MFILIVPTFIFYFAIILLFDLSVTADYVTAKQGQKAGSGFLQTVAKIGGNLIASLSTLLYALPTYLTVALISTAIVFVAATAGGVVIMLNQPEIAPALDHTFTSKWPIFTDRFMIPTLSVLAAMYRTVVPLTNTFTGMYKIATGTFFDIALDCPVDWGTAGFKLANCTLHSIESIVNFLIGLGSQDFDLYTPTTDLQDALNLILINLTRCECEVVSFATDIAVGSLTSHQLAASLDRSFNLYISLIMDTLHTILDLLAAFVRSLFSGHIIKDMGDYWWTPQRSPDFSRTFLCLGAFFARSGDWLDDTLALVLKTVFNVATLHSPRPFAIVGNYLDFGAREVNLLAMPVYKLARTIAMLSLRGSNDTYWNQTVFSLQENIQRQITLAMAPAHNASHLTEKFFQDLAAPIAQFNDSNVASKAQQLLNLFGCMANEAQDILFQVLQILSRQISGMFTNRFHQGEYLEFFTGALLQNDTDYLVNATTRFSNCTATFVKDINVELGVALNESIHVIQAIVKPIRLLVRNWSNRRDYVRNNPEYSNSIKDMFFEMDSWWFSVANVIRQFSFLGPGNGTHCLSRGFNPHANHDVPMPFLVDPYCCLANEVESFGRLYTGFYEAIVSGTIQMMVAQNETEELAVFADGGPLSLHTEFVPMLDAFFRNTGSCTRIAMIRAVADMFPETFNNSAFIARFNSCNSTDTWENLANLVTSFYRIPIMNFFRMVALIEDYIVLALLGTSCGQSCWCTRVHTIYNLLFGEYVDAYSFGLEVAGCLFARPLLKAAAIENQNLYGVHGVIQTSRILCLIPTLIIKSVKAIKSFLDNPLNLVYLIGQWIWDSLHISNIIECLKAVWLRTRLFVTCIWGPFVDFLNLVFQLKFAAAVNAIFDSWPTCINSLVARLPVCELTDNGIPVPSSPTFTHYPTRLYTGNFQASRARVYTDFSPPFTFVQQYTRFGYKIETYTSTTTTSYTSHAFTLPGTQTYSFLKTKPEPLGTNTYRKRVTATRSIRYLFYYGIGTALRGRTQPGTAATAVIQTTFTKSVWHVAGTASSTRSAFGISFATKTAFITNPHVAHPQVATPTHVGPKRALKRQVTNVSTPPTSTGTFDLLPSSTNTRDSREFIMCPHEYETVQFALQDYEEAKVTGIKVHHYQFVAELASNNLAWCVASFMGAKILDTLLGYVPTNMSDTIIPADIFFHPGTFITEVTNFLSVASAEVAHYILNPSLTIPFNTTGLNRSGLLYARLIAALLVAGKSAAQAEPNLVGSVLHFLERWPTLNISQFHLLQDVPLQSVSLVTASKKGVDAGTSISDAFYSFVNLWTTATNFRPNFAQFSTFSTLGSYVYQKGVDYLNGEQHSADALYPLGTTNQRELYSYLSNYAAGSATSNQKAWAEEMMDTHVSFLQNNNRFIDVIPSGVLCPSKQTRQTFQDARCDQKPCWSASGGVRGTCIQSSTFNLASPQVGQPTCACSSIPVNTNCCYLNGTSSVGTCTQHSYQSPTANVSDCPYLIGVCCNNTHPFLTFLSSDCDPSLEFLLGTSNMSACSVDRTAIMGACCLNGTCQMTKESGCPTGIWNKRLNCGSKSLDARCGFCTTPQCHTCDWLIRGVNDMIELASQILVNYVSGTCCYQNGTCGEHILQAPCLEGTSTNIWKVGINCSACSQQFMLGGTNETTWNPLSSIPPLTTVKSRQLNPSDPASYLLIGGEWFINFQLWWWNAIASYIFPHFGNFHFNIKKHFMDPFARFLITKDENDVHGLAFWTHFLTHCDVIESTKCNRGYGLKTGILIATAIVVGLFIWLKVKYFRLLAPLFTAGLLLVLWFFIVLMVAYLYSPWCLTPASLIRRYSQHKLEAAKLVGKGKYSKGFWKVIGVLARFPILPPCLFDDLVNLILPYLQDNCLHLCDVACPHSNGTWPCGWEPPLDNGLTCLDASDCCAVAECASDRLFPDCTAAPYNFDGSYRVLTFFLRWRLPGLYNVIFQSNFTRWKDNPNYAHFINFPGRPTGEAKFVDARWKFCYRFNLLSWAALLFVLFLIVFIAIPLAFFIIFLFVGLLYQFLMATYRVVDHTIAKFAGLSKSINDKTVYTTMADSGFKIQTTTPIVTAQDVSFITATGHYLGEMSTKQFHTHTL